MSLRHIQWNKNFHNELLTHIVYVRTHPEELLVSRSVCLGSIDYILFSTSNQIWWISFIMDENVSSIRIWENLKILFLKHYEFFWMSSYKLITYHILCIYFIYVSLEHFSRYFYLWYLTNENFENFQIYFLIIVTLVNTCWPDVD